MVIFHCSQKSKTCGFSTSLHFAKIPKSQTRLFTFSVIRRQTLSSPTPSVIQHKTQSSWIHRVSSFYRQSAFVHEIQKNTVYYTANGNPAVLHTSKTAKIIKVIIITYSTLIECQRAAKQLNFRISQHRLQTISMQLQLQTSVTFSS